MQQNDFKKLFPASIWGPYVHIGRMIWIGLLTLSLSRLALILWQYERVEPTQSFASIMLQGVRADFILMCLLAAIPLPVFSSEIGEAIECRVNHWIDNFPFIS